MINPRILLYGALIVAWGVVSDRSAGGCTAEEAFEKSQPFVTEKLEDVEIVKYPPASAPGASVTHLGQCNFSVSGFVDWQNNRYQDFRSRYSVSITYRPTFNDWIARSVVIYQ